MFNIGFSELLIIGAIALIVIGPKQLPQMARALGRVLNEIKRATGEMTQSFSVDAEKRRVLADLEKAKAEIWEKINKLEDEAPEPGAEGQPTETNSTQPTETNSTQPTETSSTQSTDHQPEIDPYDIENDYDHQPWENGTEVVTEVEDSDQHDEAEGDEPKAKKS